MTAKTCPACHAPIPADAPAGLCPACVLRDAGEPPPSGKSAPPIEEIAAAFPALEILDLIGQGGMGFVYKVRQPGLDRIVALKILSPELGRDPAFAERFAREARTLGKLHHPNIVTVFEHGESGGFFYLLMEYVDGVNLRQAMRAGRFTPQQALAIVPGICDALQAAHAQGIWHRDIKPENILIDREGRVKIADFGIARIVGDPQRDFTLTMTGNALGSAAYMAPEQHEKPHEVDHRADIYSLGVVIYEMLTGELPLGRFPIPSQRAEVNARIDEIVLRTLEKERELRQQSAEEVKTDVEGVAVTLEREPVSQASEEPTQSHRLPLFVIWSVALLISGGLMAPLSFYIMDKFRHWGAGPGGAFALAIGAVAFALGLLGCLWRLYEIKRGFAPAAGRRVMIILTIPSLAAVGFGLAAYAISTAERMGWSSAPYPPSWKRTGTSERAATEESWKTGESPNAAGQVRREPRPRVVPPRGLNETGPKAPEKDTIVNWMITLPADGAEKEKTIELEGPLRAGGVSGYDYSAVTIFVGSSNWRPVCIIIGKGQPGGIQSYSDGVSLTGSATLGRRNLKYEVRDPDKITLNNTETSLKPGRVFLFRPDGTIRQLAMYPEHFISSNQLDDFVASFPKENLRRVRSNEGESEDQ